MMKLRASRSQPGKEAKNGSRERVLGRGKRMCRLLVGRRIQRTARYSGAMWRMGWRGERERCEGPIRRMLG